VAVADLDRALRPGLSAFSLRSSVRLDLERVDDIQAAVPNTLCERRKTLILQTIETKNEKNRLGREPLS
jgi:hypothetical protein